MKYRSGFVSNSSTSSFIIIGVCFDSIKDVKKIIRSKKIKELKKEMTADGYEDSEFDDYLDDAISENSVRYFGDDSLVFGRRVGSIDYVDNLGSIKSLMKREAEAKEMFIDWFGKDIVNEISLYGVRAEG